MSTKKKAAKKWVAFRTNATIPANILGEKEDRKVQVGEPVLVPTEYADHVIHDKFADASAAPKKTRPKKEVDAASKPDPNAAETARLEAEAKVKAAREAIEARITELQAKLDGMAEDDLEFAGLTEQLTEAQAELAALVPAS